MIHKAARLRVGITVAVADGAEDAPWSSGVTQDALFLASTLHHCSNVFSVHLVNTSADRASPLSFWDVDRWPTAAFSEIKDHLDLVIELGGQLGPDEMHHLKRRGVDIVRYCFEDEYINAAEAALFDLPSRTNSLDVNQRYNAIWALPHVAISSTSYFQTLLQCPVETAPFVWAPYFLADRYSGFPCCGDYRPSHSPRRLSVIEPNVDATRFCLYPILIAEEVFRARSDLVACLQVANSEHLYDLSAEFGAVMRQLDVVRSGKTAFLGRVGTPALVAGATDAVVSHQWGSCLKSLHLEVCWLGYPLIHNSELIQDVGYYYRGHDVAAGVLSLLHALERHDHHWEEYRHTQRLNIQRFSPDNTSNIQQYESLLRRVVQKPLISGDC